jgi:hypothetical protein
VRNQTDALETERVVDRGMGGRIVGDDGDDRGREGETLACAASDKSWSIFVCPVGSPPRTRRARVTECARRATAASTSPPSTTSARDPTGWRWGRILCRGASCPQGEGRLLQGGTVNHRQSAASEAPARRRRCRRRGDDRLRFRTCSSDGPHARRDRLQIRRGILSRTLITIDRRRRRGIELERRFLSRLTGDGAFGFELV